MAVYALILLWLYYPAWRIFFSTDDWVSLYHIQPIGLRRPWEFFNFHTVLSYRPFQLLQYALSWHFFKLNPVGYNVQLFVMFLLVCLLVWELIRIQFGLARANITAAFLGVAAATPEVLIWKYNFNTYQNVILTLGAAILFTRYLQSRHRACLFSVWALVGINCFTRESAVNLPLVLVAPWVTYLQQTGGRIFEATSIKRGIRLFAPMGAIVLAFTIVYFLFYENVSPYYGLNYSFVSPLRACYQWTVCIGKLVAIPIFPGSEIGGAIMQPQPLGLSAVGIGLIALSFWWASLPFRFAVIFSAALLFPTCALKHYLQSRYYYPASGIFMGLFFSELIVSQIPLKTGLNKTVKFAAILSMCLIAIRNIVAVQEVIGKEIQRSNSFEAGFQILARKGETLNPGSIVFLKDVPEKWLLYGIGCPEMVMMATGKFTYGYPFNYIKEKDVRSLMGKHPAFVLDYSQGDFRPISRQQQQVQVY